MESNQELQGMNLASYRCSIPPKFRVFLRCFLVLTLLRGAKSARTIPG